MFADLDMGYMLNPDCVDKGEYVDHGTFGEIFHGAVYPSVHATVCVVVIPVYHCVSLWYYVGLGSNTIVYSIHVNANTNAKIQTVNTNDKYFQRLLYLQWLIIVQKKIIILYMYIP